MGTEQLIIVLSLLLSLADASCKAHDAKWKDNNQGPLVTQPSKNDPTKAMVKWDSILENSRCVDEFTLWAWKHGEAKEQGQKIVIPDHNTLSSIVTVDPCVDYSFVVDFLEKDWTHSDHKSSAVAKFTSQAVPQIMDQDKRNFLVGYPYDPVRKVHDLSRVSVRFSRAILKNPSCVKHVEISGTEMPKLPQSPFSSDLSSPPLGARGLGGLRESAPGYGGFHPGHPSHPGHPGHYNPPGSNSHYPGYNTPGGSSQFPGYPGFNYPPGGGSHYPGYPGYNNPPGYYPGYPGFSSGGGGQNVYPGSRPGSGGSFGSGGGGQGHFYPDTSTSRPGYYENNRGKRDVRTTTTHAPSAAAGGGGGIRERPPGGGGSSSTIAVTGMATPPFLHEMIEVTAPIKPCYPYKLKLKIMTPQSSVMAEISDLYMPQLSQVQDYKPPMLSKLFKVEAHQSPQPPTVKVLPNFGVPESCLEDFFYAVDAHIAHLERDLNYHLAQEMRGVAYGESMRQKLEEQKSGQLARFGCMCNSTLIRVNTTDGKAFAKHKDIFGIYSFEGMQNGRPFYHRLDSNWTLAGGRQLQQYHHPSNVTVGSGGGGNSGQRHKRFIGKIESAQPTPSPPRNTYSNVVSGVTPTPNPYVPVGPPPSGGAAPLASGHHDAFPPLSGVAPHEAAPTFSEKPFYLYWDAKTLAWAIGEKTDGKDAYFMTQKKSAAKCPADPQNAKKWQSSGTLTWHDDENMYAACM